MSEEEVPQQEVEAEEADEVVDMDDDMQAAIDLAEQHQHEEGTDVAEHLKEAVEGSFRMKRLLERDDDDNTASKKAKVMTPEKEMINKLLGKWGLQTDMVVKHVLLQIPLEELNMLNTTNYIPDKHNQWKSPGELLARYCAEMRERKMGGGGPLDVVSTFKHRFKLDALQEKAVRALTHKDLRYVLNNYDGSKQLDEVTSEAKEDQPEEETTENALPEGVGVGTIGRFGRLELIDPLADAAVFGDANLTFSVKLAKHRKALGHVGRVIATTFEDLETLKERYKEIDDSIKILEDHFCEVLHGVDCTRIAVNPNFKGMEHTLGAVYYNFPHSGAVGGFFDGHPVVNWRHENLMRLFFRALRTFVKPGGSVKVASNMGAVGVRYSYIVGGAVENEFIHVETIPFLEWHLHRYGRSYGDRRDSYKRPDAQNNQSYNAQRAEADMVYCFCYAPSGEDAGECKIVTPPSLKTLMACGDGPFKNLSGSARSNLASQLRKRFVLEASGTHVG